MAEILTPDLCVIGAGAGGLAAAEAARVLGASVILVERGTLGGLSLHSGAVPAKAMRAAAAHAQAIRSASAFGISAEALRISTRRIHDHLDQVITTIAPAISESRLHALGIDLIAADARFIDSRTLGAGETLVRARRFVIATGARPVLPSIPGLEAVPYFTTETIFDNTRKLTHLVIIGAGSLGLELAQAYRRIGTEVTVVDAGAPLDGSDPELAEIALRRMREEGVAIRANTVVTAILARSMGIGVATRSDEGEYLLDASHILIATGRTPNLEGLDLAKARVDFSPDDPRLLALTPGLRTTNRRIYAVGDAAGLEQAAHLAIYQGAAIAADAVLGWPFRRRPERIPRVTFLDPEIAEIGLSEEEATTRHGTRVQVTRWSYAENDRARVERQTFGLAKLITDRNGRILGAGVVGKGAAELIALFSLAIANGLSVRNLARFVAPYPTYAEIAQRLALEFHRGLGANPLLQKLARLVRLLP